jgi:hypothetical protein
MMKSIPKLLLVALAVALVAQTVASAATVTVTGIKSTEARRAVSSLTTNPETTKITMKSDSSNTSKLAKSWVKWDLNSVYSANPGLKGNISGATLTMYVYCTVSTARTLNVVGVNDGVAQAWTGTDITWANAPGNDTTSPTAFNTSVTTTVGPMSIPVTTGAAYFNLTPVTLTGQALVDFLNTDSDGIISLGLASGGVSFQIDLMSMYYNSGAYAPTLDLTGTPEPATLAILGLGGLLLRRRLA